MTAAREATVTASGLRPVLVVDDSTDCRRLLVIALKTAGFHVLEASCALDVQRHLRRTQPAAMVLNLMRSATDGLDLVTRMRVSPKLASVPIVFLAGCQDDDFRLRTRRAGADWFGLRPISMRELQTRVAELVRNGRPSGPSLERTG